MPVTAIYHGKYKYSQGYPMAAKKPPAKKPRPLSRIANRLSVLIDQYHEQPPTNINPEIGTELQAIRDAIDALDLRRKTRYDKGKG